MTDETVKSEQENLTVELDERLRRWAPRPGQAEMDVYEVRDPQLTQPEARKDRHIGALSMRAAAQQPSQLFPSSRTGRGRGRGLTRLFCCRLSSLR